MGNPERLSSQNALLEKINYQMISRGATFPLEYLGELSGVVGGRILNAGCGPGEKVLNQAMLVGSNGGVVFGVDINPQAIDSGCQAAINGSVGNALFIEGDVTDRGLMRQWKADELDIVIAEGLFCNLMSNDPNETVGNFSYILKRDGVVCIADCLRMDDPALEGVLQGRYEYAPREVVDKIVEGYKTQWVWRYNQNEILGELIGDVRLENGVFVVLPPEVSKGEIDALPDIGGYSELPADFKIKQLEYLDASSLVSLVSAGYVERLARHWRGVDLISMFEEQGFETTYWEETLWSTRTNEPLLGVVAMFRKN